MGIKPFTEEESRAAMVQPEGVYDFECVAAEERVSKTGNEMIALQLSLFAGEHRVRVRDWLVATPKQAFKARHFADTCNCRDLYDAGELTAEECIGRCGRVQIIIEKSEQWGDQNKVRDYGDLKPKDKPAQSKLTQSAFGSKRGSEAVSKLSPGDIPF